MPCTGSSEAPALFAAAALGVFGKCIRRVGAHGRIILVLGEPPLQISDRCFCELDLVDNAFRADVGAAVAASMAWYRAGPHGAPRPVSRAALCPAAPPSVPAGWAAGRLAQHGQQHDGQRQAGKPQCDKPPAALPGNGARRRVPRARCAGRARRISVRPRLLHAGRSCPPLWRDTHVRRMPCGTARAASWLIFLYSVCTHTRPFSPFF